MYTGSVFDSYLRSEKTLFSLTTFVIVGFLYSVSKVWWISFENLASSSSFSQWNDQISIHRFINSVYEYVSTLIDDIDWFYRLRREILNNRSFSRLKSLQTLSQEHFSSFNSYHEQAPFPLKISPSLGEMKMLFSQRSSFNSSLKFGGNEKDIPLEHVCSVFKNISPDECQSNIKISRVHSIIW